MANIMRLAFHGDDLTTIAASLQARIAADSMDSAAMMDLSVVLQLNENPLLATQLQWEALRQHQYFDLATNPKNPSLKLLAIMGAW